MAKAKTQPKKVKKAPTKYSKLLVVAQKELETRKKALVSAERALAKAKQKHEELIQEVARLDMVERSLKAMVEGTEPPTNVRYVYNYPQWVWYPVQQPYVTYTTPSWQYTPSTTVPSIYSVNTPNLGGSALCNGNFSGGLQSGTITCNTTTSGLSGTYQNSSCVASAGDSGAFSAGMTPTLNNFTLTSTAPQSADSGCMVIDLSTGADQFSDDKPAASADQDVTAVLTTT